MNAVATVTPPDVLTGELVQLWPYVRGYVPRDMLYQLWCLLESDAEVGTIFYHDPSDEAGRAMRGDLHEFVVYMSQMPIIMVVRHIESGEIAGFLWCDQLVDRLRANISLYFRRGFRGPIAFEAGLRMTRYMLEVLGYKYVWGWTPWPAVRNFAKRIGYKDVGRLPAYCTIDGEERDLYIVRISQEDL